MRFVAPNIFFVEDYFGRQYYPCNCGNYLFRNYRTAENSTHYTGLAECVRCELTLRVSENELVAAYVQDVI